MKHSIRIISGNLRNRRINVIDRPLLRPTKERLRETVFNWIGGTIVGSKVADIFAGTGAYGIESISRGAQSCTFLDIDPLITKNITKIINQLKINQSVEILTGDLFLQKASFLKKSKIIFADPPFSYHKSFKKNLIQFLEKKTSKNCLLALEFETNREFELGSWKILRHTTAGNSSAYLLERSET